MKVFEHKIAEKLLKEFVPENILSLNPIIAGGSIVSLYNDVILNKNPKSQLALEHYLCNSISNQEVLNLAFSHNSDSYKQNKSGPLSFGDIDLWFASDNPIWNEDHPCNFLVKDHQEDTQAKSHAGLYQTSPVFYQAGRKYDHEMKALGLDKNSYIINSTSWANTFRSAKPHPFTRPIQAIKKPAESIQKLFDGFDIMNCCAGYYNGKFYIEEDFEEAFRKRELVFGKNSKRNTVVGRVWVADRAFKYAKRYVLEFSKQSCEDITQIFFDAEELVQKIKSGEVNNIIPSNELGEVVEVQDGYGRVLFSMNKETLLSIIENFLCHFTDLIHMKNFEDDYIFAFLNSKNYSIISEVKRYIEIQEMIARGEGEAKEVSWTQKSSDIF